MMSPSSLILGIPLSVALWVYGFTLIPKVLAWLASVS